MEEAVKRILNNVKEGKIDVDSADNGFQPIHSAPPNHQNKKWFIEKDFSIFLGNNSIMMRRKAHCKTHIARYAQKYAKIAMCAERAYSPSAGRRLRWRRPT